MSACFFLKDSEQNKYLKNAFSSFKDFSSNAYKEVYICTNENANKLFNIEDHLFTNSTGISNETLLSQKIKYPETWLNSGCWRWKPHLVKNVLSKLKEGDVLVYHDINVLKYPEYFYNISLNPERFNEFLGKESILLFSPGYKPLFCDSKGYFLKKFGFYKNFRFLMPGFWSGCIAFRKDIISSMFVDKWASNATFENYYPLPDLEPKERFFEFIHHSSCQAGIAEIYYNFKEIKPYIKVAHLKSNRLITTATTKRLSLIFLIARLAYIKSIAKKLFFYAIKFPLNFFN